MAKSKWFSDLTAATPQQTAAQRVLTARVRTVEHHLERVAVRLGEAPEDVHQLRVATRRLTAGLAVFKPVLDSRLRRRVRRAARRLRRAAGAVRDLDVQRGMLEDRLKLHADIPAAVAKSLLRKLDRRGRQALQVLAQVVPRWAETFRKAAADLLGNLEIELTSGADSATNLGAIGRVVLNKQLDQLFAAGQADLAALNNLHQLRIAAKRLRYAMEVFAGCYPAEFRGGLYKQVESVQSELGHLNDLRNLIQTIGELRPEAASRGAAARRAMAARLIDQVAGNTAVELRERQHEFIARWPKRQRDLRKQFKRFLGRRVII